jgi:membrane-bound serine protease (ClpP class)
MNELLLLGLGLMAAALLLVVIEVFIPSAGVISLVAAAVAITGVVVLFRVSAGWGAAGLLAMVILGPLTGFFALQILPNTPMGRRMLFGEAEQERAVLTEGAMQAPDHLLGAEGVAVTDLRPIGEIRVGEERIDAVSEISFLSAGARVRITGVEPTRVRVRPVS